MLQSEPKTGNLAAGGPGQPGSPKSGYGGWIRLDSDHVLRGWATDRVNRSVRPMVEITIDDAVVARVRADRLDPKLVELGEGDGRYAFAVIIPARFRDGETHLFGAVAPEGGFALRVKQPSFCIGPDARPPRIEIDSVAYGVAKGRLSGGAYSKSTTLELWRNDERLEAPVVTAWSGSVGDLQFSATFPPEVFIENPRGLRLAAPGMIEGELAGAPIRPGVSLAAQCDETGLLTVELDGVLEGLDGRLLELRLHRVDQEGEGVGQRVTLDRFPLRLRLPAALAGDQLCVSLRVDGHAPPELTAMANRSLGQLVRNGAFERWSEGLIEDWRIGPGVEMLRGFHAFPNALAQTQGLAGDLAQFSLPPSGPERRVLLSQPFSTTLRGDDVVDAAVMFRASKAAELHLRLLDRDGMMLAGLTARCEKPWAWTLAADAVAVPKHVTEGVVELSIATPEAVALDIAGARLGGDGFRDRRAVEAPRTANAVENPDLQLWPHGVTLKRAGGRHETARGWFVINQRCADPVLAAAWMNEEDVAGGGYLVGAESAPNGCRVEVRLDPAAMATLDKGQLRFEAGIPLAARRLLGRTAAPVSEFLVIDRVCVLRRRRTVSGKEVSHADDIVAVPARKVLLTRRLHHFDFPVSPKQSVRTEELAWEDVSGDPSVEYFLVFELKGPFALALRNVRLVRAAATAAPSRPTRLELEDRNIAVQAEHVLGLEAWLSPEPLSSETAAASDPSGASGQSIGRWRWGRSELGHVEVVVCVHDALDETLACLTSLVECSTVPHTVQIVDDGSAAEVARRVEAFIADKPWMRLVRHAENLGYTRAADGAIRNSDADWVVLLNSDTVATPGWIEGLLEASASDPAIVLVGPISNAASFQSVPELYDAKGRFKVNALPAGWSPARMAAVVSEHSEKAFPQVPLLNGFCTLIRRSAFLALGGFNEGAFPTGYGEENDLCTRAIKAGFKLAVADHVYVYHSKSASFGAARRAELSRTGGRTLKTLHPDVDFEAATTVFRDVPALVRLRAAVRQASESAEGAA